MTSTQRSESANHMLKNYIPPGSPMHKFVTQYMRSQFDRQSEESYEEKRTKIGGAVLRVNLSFERHASQVYTRAMFEQFVEILHDAGRYRVERLEENVLYRVRHTQADDGKEFECECGLFEHMGMLCCHALKVMDNIGLDEIPERRIVKRWTKDARDILPDHLKHYQRNKINTNSLTFRHRLYVKALELVRLGDASVEAYETLDRLFEHERTVMPPFDMCPDGLGLEDQPANNKDIGDGTLCLPNGDTADDRAFVSTNPLVGLSTPSKKRTAGRPTNAKDKAPYEGLSNRSRFCNICRGRGHKKPHALKEEICRSSEGKKPGAANVVNVRRRQCSLVYLCAIRSVIHLKELV